MKLYYRDRVPKNWHFWLAHHWNCIGPGLVHLWLELTESWPISQIHRFTNPVTIEVKITWLAQVQDRKGTPFGNFRRNLSTNEKPAFWALDQSGASIWARFLALTKVGVHQSNANVPIGCFPLERIHPSAQPTNLIPIENQSEDNWDPI